MSSRSGDGVDGPDRRQPELAKAQRRQLSDLVPPALDPRSRTPKIVGAMTYVVGLVDVASGLNDTWRHRLDIVVDVLPGAIGGTATAVTVVSGILLLLLAHALRRRKRRAWRATVTLLSFSVLIHVAKLEPVSLVASLLVLVALVAYRRQFYALGDPATRWRAVWAFAGLLATSVVLGTAAVELSGARNVAGVTTLPSSLLECLYGLVGATSGLTYRSDRATDIVGSLLLGLGLMTVLTTFYLAIRAPEPQPVLSAQDESRMRVLLARGTDSLGYFNLRRDKSVIWSESGKAAIGYRVVSGVMLASGDPIGDREAWPGAIRAFLDEAAAHAWTPAVLGCTEVGGTIWARESQFSAIELGDEAVVDTAEFSLEGRSMRNVRQMVKRIERAGYTTQVTRASELTPGDRRRALQDAAAWRGSNTERGFSMALGRLGDPDDPDCVLVLARQDGVVRAFLQFVPWGADGMSLDIMRRDRQAEAGVNELLIVDALRAASDLGIKRVSLNFAAFRAALDRGERLGAGPVLRLWRDVLLFLSRWFQIESLYRFNAKFQPQWQPRFLIYPHAADLPRVAMAALEAEAFLVWPKLRFFGWTRS